MQTYSQRKNQVSHNARWPETALFSLYHSLLIAIFTIMVGIFTSSDVKAQPPSFEDILGIFEVNPRLHPCRIAIDCDCSNQNAGILSGPWAKECRNCERPLLNECIKNYNSSLQSLPEDAKTDPAIRTTTAWAVAKALKKSGFCSACITRGPRWRPRPRPDGGGDIFGTLDPALMKKLCKSKGADDWQRVTQGSMLMRGCLKDGKRVGTWIGKYEKAGKLQVLEYTWQGKLRLHREIENNKNIMFKIYNDNGEAVEPPLG